MSRPLCVLVDDTRNFRVPRGELVARTSAEALALVRELHASQAALSDLWLDYDLGLVDAEGSRAPREHAVRKDTVMALVLQLADWACHDQPLQIERVWIHTSNAPGRDEVRQVMSRWGYTCRIVDAGSYFLADPVLSAWE